MGARYRPYGETSQWRRRYYQAVDELMTLYHQDDNDLNLRDIAIHLSLLVDALNQAQKKIDKDRRDLIVKMACSGDK